jgi:hypothetical protein
VESGKNSDRAQLALALNACRLIGATLMIAKLDRLTRNVAFLANLMEGPGSSSSRATTPMRLGSRFTFWLLLPCTSGSRS